MTTRSVVVACGGAMLIAHVAGAQPSAALSREPREMAQRVQRPAPTDEIQKSPPRISSGHATFPRSRLRGRFEVTIGGGWWGDANLGNADASIIENTIPEGGDFRLFGTTTRIASALAFEAMLGYRLTPLVSVEGGLGLAQPAVRTTVSGDVEVPDTITATDRLTQVNVDGALVVRLPRLRIARVVPFLRGGAGYVRQLHEGRRVVDTGQTFFVGAGAMYPLFTQSQGAIRRVALRGDVRAVWYRDTFEIGDGRAAGLNAGLGLTVGF